MALTAFKGNVVRKQDIFTAKNYLNKDEIDTLNRLVVVFLETAELRAKNRRDITMAFWQELPIDTLVITITANMGSLAILSFKAYFPDSVIGF